MKCLFCGGELGTTLQHSYDTSKFCINQPGNLWVTNDIYCRKRDDVTIKSVPGIKKIICLDNDLDICLSLMKIMRSSILI